MVLTYILGCSELPDPLEAPDRLCALPDSRIEKIKRIKHKGARKQSFGAGLLLDYALQKAWDSCGDNQSGRWEVQYNAYGKPSAGSVPFSLSHTEEYVALSIWGKKKIPKALQLGCDIEPVKAYRPQVARRFFTAEEYKELELTQAGAQAELFCRYWTRKESVLKLTGLGIALPMDLFDVRSLDRADADKEKVIAWHRKAKEKLSPEFKSAAMVLLNQKMYFKEYRYGGCVLSVCSTDGQFAGSLLPLKL